MPDSDLRQVRLRWTGEGLAFRGGPDGGVESGIDSDGVIGHSPMEALLMALAGCMAVDVLMILEKSRVPIEELEVEAVGRRAPTVPKRYVAVTLTYRLKGPSGADRPKVDRAIDLSRDKYCSVLHTLDPELDIDIEVETGS
ncbi:MAG: OsmC family protein [Gemmatimonadetes bacterium]|nr:OsmC family protein [Gemmatimonadota bacterium]NNF13045.1 OsmC family protein [Gemmatimonadota bacterium]NNL31130.1 OsmC family protein [Gemmatimonadota bacterium]